MRYVGTTAEATAFPAPTNGRHLGRLELEAIVRVVRRGNERHATNPPAGTSKESVTAPDKRTRNERAMYGATLRCVMPSIVVAGALL